jgi:hypothetical protein
MNYNYGCDESPSLSSNDCDESPSLSSYRNISKFQNIYSNFIELNHEEKLTKILNPSTAEQIRTVTKCTSFIRQSLELRDGNMNYNYGCDESPSLSSNDCLMKDVHFVTVLICSAVDGLSIFVSSSCYCIFLCSHVCFIFLLCTCILCQ